MRLHTIGIHRRDDVVAVSHQTEEAHMIFPARFGRVTSSARDGFSGVWTYAVEGDQPTGVQRILEGVGLITLRAGVKKVETARPGRRLKRVDGSGCGCSRFSCVSAETVSEIACAA